MKKIDIQIIISIILSFTLSILPHCDAYTQNINLTFRVDMSQEDISTDGVHIAGDFQQEAGYNSDWDPAATALTDANDDTIYDITVTLPPGTYYYKFINGDAWSDQPENPDSYCAENDGTGNYNREVVLGEADRILPVVMFDSCNAMVTFKVNMSAESVSTDGVHVMGTFQQSAGFSSNWDASTIPMLDNNNDDIYEAGIQMPSGDYQYLYVNGNDSADAETPPDDCTVANANENNVRTLNATVDSGSLPAYVYDSCTLNNGTLDYETYWWNDAVFYEIFVRSFYDSDGDGIGDLQGIIEKLDYLNDGNPETDDDLGITGIWLMPIMESPSYHGYDATDYYTINPDYGTMEDFEALLDAAQERGIKIILDLVMNHCSSQHPWFTQSANNQNNYRDWFVWSDTDPGFTEPWGQDVWHYKNGDYYYGIFWSGMPDLNYSHEPVKTEMFDVAEFWLNKGADGFRLDAIKYLDEDGETLENTPETFQLLEDFHVMYKNVNPDAFTVGEVWSSTSSVVPYVQNDRLDVCFEFDLAGAIINSVENNSPGALINKFENIQESYATLQYATFLTNHDMDRIYSVLGENNPAMKQAAAIYLSLPGIPFIYYGEEIGMTGTGAHENIRTPMQWNSGNNAGFTSGTPWEPIGDNYTTHNVADMQNDANSLLHAYQALIHTRNEFAPLRKGYLQQINNAENQLLSFARIYENEAVIVVSNLGNNAVQPTLSLNASGLPAGKYAVTELQSHTALDSLNINENGGFSGWVPDMGELETNKTRMFYLTQTGSLEVENIQHTEKAVNIYPNPAQNFLYVERPRENKLPAQIRIFDISGKVLITDKLQNAKAKINIANLQAGLYFVKMRSKACRYDVQMFIKK